MRSVRFPVMCEKGRAVVCLCIACERQTPFLTTLLGLVCNLLVLLLSVDARISRCSSVARECAPAGASVGECFQLLNSGFPKEVQVGRNFCALLYTCIWKVCFLEGVKGVGCMITVEQNCCEGEVDIPLLSTRG